MSDWVELAIRVNVEAQEAATEILYGKRAQGVWLIDEGDKVLIKTFFPKQDLNPEKVGLIKDALIGLTQFGLNPGPVEILTTNVAEEDWADSWKEYFYPEKISETFVIKPTWREYKPQPGEKVIELDPGMAFGTGTHASTYLAVQALEEVAPKQPNMLDVGTGSGILAIAAAYLGIPKITAVDIDSVALKVATENALLNKVQKQIQLMRSDLLKRLLEKGKKFKLITANILADVIIKMIPDLPLVLEDDGYFIASGIISERFSDLKKALNEQELKVVKILREGEWIALIVRK